MFYFATESGDHVIKILICDWSVTGSEIESLITFYSSMWVSGARKFATGVKNRRQKPTPVFWRRFLEHVSLPLGTSILVDDVMLQSL